MNAYDIRNEVITAENNARKADGYDDRYMVELSDLSSGCDDLINTMMSRWLELNPQVSFTNKDDFTNAVDQAVWRLRHDEAVTIFNGEDYHLNVDSIRWNIEQAIINRDSGKTMHQAAFEYVESKMM